MRTTVRLDDDLLAEVKRYAGKHRKTLTAVIEESLRRTLLRKQPLRRSKAVKLTTVKGHGPLPGVDLDDTASLLDRLDDKHVSA